MQDHDLANFDVAQRSADGVPFHIPDVRTGGVLVDWIARKHVTITLRGVYCPVMIEARARIWRERIAKLDDARRAIVDQGCIPRLLPDEQLEDAIEVCVAATVRWDGIKFEGEMLPFTPVNARRLYRRVPWLRDAAIQFTANIKNFIKPD